MATTPETAAPEAGADAPAPPMDKFRFRVQRVKDGSELIAPVLAIPRGMGRVGDPFFVNHGFAHGEWAEVMVAAQGLDGKKVCFKLNAKTDGDFQPYEEAVGEVVKGWATAKFKLQHPDTKGQPGAPAPAVQFELKAVLV